VALDLRVTVVGDRHWFALGGVVGPVAFVAAWIGCGLATDGYSAVSNAISDLARLGASTRVAMTIGFVVFGFAVPLYAVALRRALAGPAWIAATMTGLATLGVAAVPLGWGRDGLHGLFASIGYVTLALTPALAVRPLRDLDRGRWAVASLAAAVIAGLCLIATVAGPAHGLFQRAGLFIGDAWIVASAVVILTRRGWCEDVAGCGSWTSLADSPPAPPPPI